MKIDQLDGTYDRDGILRLTWPVGWSGAPDREYEAARASLVEAARDALEADPDAVGVEISGGVVVATIHGDEVTE
jgi:hypothetical protein